MNCSFWDIFGTYFQEHILLISDLPIRKLKKCILEWFFYLSDFLFHKKILLTELLFQNHPKLWKDNFDISKNVGVQEETPIIETVDPISWTHIKPNSLVPVSLCFLILVFFNCSNFYHQNFPLALSLMWCLEFSINCTHVLNHD